MSERNQIVVVLIVALLLGAVVDRITVLKVVAGAALLWMLQNLSAILECIRKLSSLRRGGPSVPHGTPAGGCTGRGAPCIFFGASSNFSQSPRRQGIRQT